MAERVPLWHRLQALSADSRAWTLLMATVVSAVSALAVSLAAILLEPRIEANRAAERQAKLDAMIAAMPELAGILAESGAESLESVVVDLATGRATDIDPEGYDVAGAVSDPALSTELSDAQDIAGIGRRPNAMPIHILRAGGDLALVVLPVYAQGYQSTIRASLALKGDLNTVAGLTVTDQGETPGLGSKIAEPGWQALWPGKKLMDESGMLRFEVVRGKATTEYQVDGITGATRTSNAVGDMIAFWMGPQGYARVLEALAAGDL